MHRKNGSLLTLTVPTMIYRSSIRMLNIKITNAEAIDEINCIIMDFPCEDIDFISIEAVEALEKQIPKKVKSEPWGDILIIKCPACSQYLEWDPYELSCPDYCPYCGQCLDWSEDET